MEGKFFSIRSAMNDLCLDIQENVLEPGTPIITWEFGCNDNQLWSFDHAYNVIRSKADDNLVLDNQGGQLVISEYNPDESSQKWYIEDNKIHCLTCSEQVIDVAEANPDPGASICCYEYNGGDNQHWSLVHTDPFYCFIESEDNGKVMDVKGDDEDEDARIILYKRKEESYDNQLFYEDRNGLIRSKMTDFVFDTHDEDKLRVREYDGDVASQRWVKSGKKIVHRDDPTRCLQTKSGGFMSKPKVEVGEYSGDVSQRWQFHYI